MENWKGGVARVNGGRTFLSAIAPSLRSSRLCERHFSIRVVTHRQATRFMEKMGDSMPVRHRTQTGNVRPPFIFSSFSYSR